VNWVLDASPNNVGVGGFTAPVVSGSNSPVVDLYGLSKGTSTTIPSGAVLGLGRFSTSGINFAAVLQALQTDSRNNIIATPFTTTQDNVEAKLSASRQVPFITGQYTGTTGTTSAFQTIQRQDVGTILTVTPRINSGNTVLMKLDVESSQLESSRTSGAADLITNKRSTTSTVLVKDDDTLVLGGFISDGSDASESRVPYLGRIPVIGELFRTRSKSHDKRVLMIFVHPKILRSDEDGQTITDAKYEQMRDQQKALNKETTVAPLINKKGATQLPERKSGAPIPTLPTRPVTQAAPAPAATQAQPAPARP
jgi:general secretion pathway protein D